MLNVADPDAAMRWWRLPTRGIGLARLEFVIEHQVKVHPMALVRFDELEPNARARVAEITAGYEDKEQYFVDTLSQGVATLAAQARALIETAWDDSIENVFGPTTIQVELGDATIPVTVP